MGVVTTNRGALPAISPDGELAAMTVLRRLDSHPSQLPHSRVALNGLPVELARGLRLRVWRVADGSPVEPFAEWTASWAGQWSPDGRRLAAYLHRGVDAPRLGVWDRDTDTVRVLDGPAGPEFPFERPQWALGGTALVAELRPEAPLEQAWTPPDVVEPGLEELSVTVLSTADEHARRPDFAGLDVADLGLVGLDGGLRVLARGWIVRAWRVSPDGSQVACLRVDPEANDEVGMSFQLAVIDLGTGAVRIVADPIWQAYGIGWSWSPDGNRIAYLQQKPGEIDALWLADPTGRTTPVRLTRDCEQWPRRRSVDRQSGGYEVPRWLDPETVVWYRVGTGFVRCPIAEDGSIDGDHGAAVITPADTARGEVWLIDPDAKSTGSDIATVAVNSSDGRCEIHAVDLRSGHRKVLDSCPGTAQLSQLQVGGSDGTALFVLEADSGSAELWTVDHGSARRIASLNPELRWPHTSRLIDWRTGGSEQRRGAVFVPATEPPASGYPLVISVYGGANLSHLVDVRDPDNGILHTSLLTSRGYAVLFPDLPVDAGRLPMAQFAASLAPGIDRVCGELPIDTDRISLIGNSYGSYTILSLLITMPAGTFSAAAVSAPVINPFASYGVIGPDGTTMTSYWETGQGSLRTPPWEDPAAWVANTPYLRLDRVSTPVLIGVGSGGIPGEQAQATQLYSGLRRLGRPAELRQYANETHPPSMWSVPAYRDFATRCLQWLENPPSVQD